MKNQGINLKMNLLKAKTMFLHIVLLFLFSIACKNQPSAELVSIEIEKNINNFKPFKLSDLNCSLEYIPLETNEKCFLTSIHHIDYSEEYFIINDTKKCYLFDKSGKYIRQIGDNGKGPQEYSYPCHPKIFNNKIYIPNAIYDILKVYNINGEFKKDVTSHGRFTTEKQLCNWYPYSDSTFFVQIVNETGHNDTRIELIDDNGQVIKKFANSTFFSRVRPNINTLDLAGNFYEFDGHIKYKEEIVDTIWEVNPSVEKLQPVYVFDLGELSIPNQYRDTDAFGEKFRESILLKRIYEVKDYFFIETVFHKHYPFNFRYEMSAGGVSFQNQYHIVGIFEKKSKKMFFVSPSNTDDQITPTGIENDFDGGINFFPMSSSNDSTILSWVQPYELKSYIKNKSFINYNPKYPEKKKALVRLADSLDENDNPVLMLVKLKE